MSSYESILFLNSRVISFDLRGPWRRDPKNGVSRSKRLLKPQPIPHQHWAWEFRTSLTTDTKKSRDSKEAAVQLFLSATISLLKEKPILDITLQDIADRAGLNHGYVFRYFGTRLDLFFAVTEELAQLAEIAVASEMERRLQAGEAATPLNLSLVEFGRAYLRQRQAVIQYLVTAGVDPTRFSETSRKTTEYFAQQFVNLGMNERMAITQATKLSILLWAEGSVASIFGVRKNEADDIRALSLDMIVHANDISKRLGWG
ncbi:MAG: TetR/AcrR family transcriptional regulator [Actinobacteria bacterium]|nr:TetR/AcrR family transcriptional regulator [Actinomycetota bacterium]